MPLNTSKKSKSSTHSTPVMVTGASGFLGARIVRALLIDGFPVTAVVRSLQSPSVEALRRMIESDVGVPLSLVPCELHDREAVDAMVARHSPALCVHAAWSVEGENYRNDAINQEWVKSSLHLFTAMVRSGCQWFGALGTCLEPAHNERPSCRYAAAKSTLRHRIFEMMAAQPESAAGDEPMRACWLKIFQPYGPGEAAQRFVPSCIEANLRGESFTVKSPDAVRDFVHVDDIATAVTSAVVHRAGGAFDVGTGTGHRVADVAKLIAQLVKNAKSHESAAASDGPSPFIANPGLLMSTCEWTPIIDLRGGLRPLIEQLRPPMRAVA